MIDGETKVADAIKNAEKDAGAPIKLLVSCATRWAKGSRRSRRTSPPRGRHGRREIISSGGGASRPPSPNVSRRRDNKSGAFYLR